MPARANAPRANGEPLYAAILAGLGVPGALHPRSPDREGAALHLLRRVECRMLVIDELHNLLAAPNPGNS